MTFFAANAKGKVLMRTRKERLKAKTIDAARLADLTNQTTVQANNLEAQPLVDLAPDNSAEVKGGTLAGQTIRVQFRSTTDFSD
jgi:hypothetical protein